MNTNARRLNIGILFILISLPAAWVVTGGRAAESAPGARQSTQPTRGELHQLVKARYTAAATLLEVEEKKLEQGKSSLMKVCEAARRVADSAKDLTGDRVEQINALSKCLAVTRRLEEETDKAVKMGAAPPSDRELARYFRLDAEIALLRARLQGSEPR